MTTITYKFSIDQEVKTTLGDIGVVQMLGFDDGGNQYYVRTSNSPGWWKEEHLESLTGKKADEMGCRDE